LKKNSSEEVEVIFMRNDKDPDNFFGNFNQKGWFTPFTGLRWAISEYCNFEGRAIYMDTDQVNFRDISELYNMDLHGKPFGCRYNRLCVMVFDNEKMKDKVPSVSKQRKMSGNYTAQVYWTFLGQAAHFDDRWNCLDGEGRKPEDIFVADLCSKCHKSFDNYEVSDAESRTFRRIDHSEQFQHYILVTIKRRIQQGLIQIK
jgi:hypothetical protein